MKYKTAAIVLGLAIAVAAFHGAITEERQGLPLQIDNQTVNVEVANTSAERREGLMYRRNLPENHGMLFVYPDEDKRSFWMKNTYIPLDIIFVDSNGEVINIEQADPEPNTSDENLKRYRSESPAKYVIEVKQGFSREHNITPGSKVVFGEELAECCVKPS